MSVRGFGDDGLFRHPSMGYGTTAVAPAPSRWRIENYQLDDDGRPTIVKTSMDYVHTIRVDGDGDGVFESSAKMPAYDLLYANRRSTGRIFLSHLPLSPRRAESDLQVLGRLYVEAASGTGVNVRAIEGGVEVTERRFATRILTEREVTFGGVPAYEVVFEIANVDQLAVDPNARTERGRVVLARPGLVWAPDGRLDRAGRRSPLLFIAGHASHPDDFDAEAADFDEWLSAFTFNPNEVSPEVRARIRACAPSWPAVPVIVVPGGRVADDARRFIVPGATHDMESCVRAAFAGVPTLRRHTSWVFVPEPGPDAPAAQAPDTL